MATGVIIFAIGMSLVALTRFLQSKGPVHQAVRAFVRRRQGYEMRQSDGAFGHRAIPERRYLVRLREIDLQIWVEARADAEESVLELEAQVAVPPCPGMVLDSSSNAAPPEALEVAWKTAVAGVRSVSVRCDGRAVGATARRPVDDTGVEAVADLVAAVARLDGGLGETLLALPDARSLTGHALVPGVVLGSDGLVIGVRNRTQVVAQLDDVTHVGQLPGPTQELVARAGDGELLVTEHGARFTWKGIERDPAKLRAGVDALRSLRGATGPYR
jgi:hypothetical protein